MDDKKEIMIIDEASLKDKIYVIRGQQVMLDSDLAGIYGYTTKSFNQQVKNNAEKFPEDFRFQLTKEEVYYLRSKNLTANISTKSRSNPYVFTESGIYMLMSILRGELATCQSINLIRLFKEMKDYLIDNQPIISQSKYFELFEKVEEHENDIKQLKKQNVNMVTKADLSDFMRLFDSGIEQEEILILDGQPFKADIAYQKIYSRAKRRLVIIDDYISTKTLQHLAHTKANVTVDIISDNKGKHPLRLTELQDFMAEYPGRKITFRKSAGRVHDRYIILDYSGKDIKVYHCGASSKDAGKRITTITRIKDITGYKEMLTGLLNNSELKLK